MKSCIITVIKNEQDYLDEWIKYHLDFGIDHLFILEDTDSFTHKHITNEYKEKVSLMNVFDVLTLEERVKAVNTKKTKDYNLQHLYFKKGLMYIVDKYPEYDWCFVLDADEFVTLENSTADLDTVLSKYTDFEAFLLWWKCYDANGHIMKPDYGDKGLIGTYTHVIDRKISDTSSKTCYNLKRFKPEVFYNQHIPYYKSKCCNTLGEPDSGRPEFSKRPEFSNIYIRHYITKSWEEYVQKRKRRGFLWGQARGLHFFFMMNRDLMEREDELMAMKGELMGKPGDILVVLPYKQNKSQGKELFYSLNLWNKFCGFKCHFIVIGEFENYLQSQYNWVEFIHYPNIKHVQGQYNQHLNVQCCMEYIMEKYGNDYDGFIWMVDDNYAVNPFTLNDIMTVHYFSNNITGNESAHTSYWIHDKWKTKELLLKEKLPCRNYTTHFPCWLEFRKLKEIWDKYDMRNNSYVLEDIYFNYFKHEEPVKANTIRFGIWNILVKEEDIYKKYKNWDIKFMCNGEDSWSDLLERCLEKILNDKFIMEEPEQKNNTKNNKHIIMTKNDNIYTAGEGKLIVRKADNFIMGDAIDLGSADSIDNYEEREFTEEEIDAFFKSVGVERPGKKSNEKHA